MKQNKANVNQSDIKYNHVPIKENIKYYTKEDNVVILVPYDHFLHNFFRKTIAKKLPLNKEITLDIKSSFIWHQIDGTSNIQLIYDNFCSKFSNDEHSIAAFGTVIAYFKQQKWINLL